jgi:hypothetical protein
MSLPVGAQLSLELTKIIPVRAIVTTTFQKAIEFARSLQKTGSDILVEEDLAAIFGRGKIVRQLELRFRQAINVSIQPVPISPRNGIELTCGPGATVGRALKDNYYLATVIQLSFLSWFHEKSSLAGSLVDCIEKRIQMGVPDANTHISYEGVLGTLDACAAETNRFAWDALASIVQGSFLNSTRTLFTEDTLIRDPFDPFMSLAPHMLLGLMDSLYLVQSFPEDRFIILESPRGAVLVVIWAHFLLGLSVVVLAPERDIFFGESEKPQVVIKWKPDWDPMKDTTPSLELLDRNANIVLKYVPEDNTMISLSGMERIRLEGYAKHLLRRYLNKAMIMLDNDPAYKECAEMATAMAISMSKLLRRVPYFSQAQDGTLLDIPPQCYSNTEQWRIFDSGEFLFSGISLEKNVVNLYARSIVGVPFDKIQFPPCIRSSQCVDIQILRDLAWLVLLFANVNGLESCASVPLPFASLPFYNKKLDSWDGQSPLDIESDIWFGDVVGLLRGISPGDREQKNYVAVSLICEHGWSAYVGSFGDQDPGDINCELVMLKEGVPTSVRSGERKYQIIDAELPRGARIRPPSVVEKEGVYKPRCVSRVTNREIFYSTRATEFRQLARYDVDESGANLLPNEKPQFSLFASYRLLHNILWHVITSVPCEHGSNIANEASLDLGVATVRGFYWDGGEGDARDYRICICLVKGDKHARWLLLTGIRPDGGFMRHQRRVLLRKDGCCPNCAVYYASRQPGKWLVIL